MQFLILLMFIALIIVFLITVYKMFEKAGEKGWKVIVPFYNQYILFKIAGLNPWLFLITYLPFLFELLTKLNSIFTGFYFISTAILVGLQIYLLYSLRNVFVKENNEKMTLWKFIIGIFLFNGLLIYVAFISDKYKYIDEK